MALRCMQKGVIPISLATFADLLSGDLPSATLLFTPIRRYTRRIPMPVVPHRSTHLAKKVVNQTLAVAAL
jgi:hypothetical protein